MLNSYLPDATSFVDLPKRTNPNELPDNLRKAGNWIECPKCHGHGGWNLTLDAYGKGKHFNACCSQCNGWGWVKADSKDASCIHEWRELSQKECAERGTPHFGMCWHVYVCTKCNETSAHDSSG